MYGLTPAALRSKLAKVLFPKMITKANKMRDKDAYYTPTAGGMAADQIPVESAKGADALVRLDVQWGWLFSQATAVCCATLPHSSLHCSRLVSPPGPIPGVV
jgi:hypothetical protein